MYQSRPVDEADEPDLNDLATYIVPSTGAILTHLAAIPLLSEFCSLLPSDMFTLNPKPIYQIHDGFIAQVNLPMIACLPGKREFNGSLMATKKAAKQSVAFAVCIELHKNGALTDYLLPVRQSRSSTGFTTDADGNFYDPTPTPKSVGIQTKNYFGNFRLKDSKVYLHILDLIDGNESYSIGLIAGAAFIDFDNGEYFESNPSRSVSIKLRKVLDLDWSSYEERMIQLNRLEEFNRICVRVTINRKIKDQVFYALWAPLLESELVDWNLVESAYLPISVESLAEGDRIVVPFRRGTYRMFDHSSIRQDVNSLSPTKDIEGEERMFKNKLIGKYPNYAHYIAVAFDNENISRTIAEPILVLSPIPSFSRNHLIPLEDEPVIVVKELKKKFYPASMCRISKLPDSFFKLYTRTPSLLRIIQDAVCTKDALRTFEFPAIDLKQLSLAMTPPSALTGFNYQTLETIGDSALKLATTIHICRFSFHFFFFFSLEFITRKTFKP